MPSTSPRRSPGLHALVAAAVAVGGLSLVTATSSSAAATSVVGNGSFTRGTSGWTVSSTAKKSTVKQGRVRALAVRNKTSRTRTVTATSARSSSRLTAGSTVKVSAKVRSTSTHGKVQLVVREHTTRGTTTTVKGRAYTARRSDRSLSVSLRTRSTGSRVSVQVVHSGLRPKQSLRVSQVKGTATAPAVRPAPRPQGAASAYLPNARCDQGAAGWSPSSNATIAARTQSSAPTTSCVLTPRSSSASNVSATSSLGGRTVTRGSTVHVAAQVRASQAGRPLTMTLAEVSGSGKVVQSFVGRLSSSTGWQWTGAKLVTKGTDSRVRVTYAAQGLTSRRTYGFANATATVTAPAATPTPAPTQAPTPAPAPTQETTPYIPVSTCDAMNDPSRRRLTFADEFDGTTVDTTKWRVRDNTSLGFDAAYIQKENVTVSGGAMTIAGRRLSEPVKVSGATPERWYSTGYVDTIGKFSQKYGRWEMRAKLPTDGTRTKGVWPAFWLRGDHTAGEIDIMESYGAPSAQARYNPSRSYTSTLWEDTNLGSAQGKQHWSAWAHKDWQTHSPAVYEDFHTYGLNWSPDCLQFTFDDQVVSSVRTADVPWVAKAFDGPFNIRLNMQIGSSYWGMPNATDTKPAFDYVIDHVRAWAPAS